MSTALMDIGEDRTANCQYNFVGFYLHSVITGKSYNSKVLLILNCIIGSSNIFFEISPFQEKRTKFP